MQLVGVTGMTGNELVRQILTREEYQDHILGFDNFICIFNGNNKRLFEQ